MSSAKVVCCIFSTNIPCRWKIQLERLTSFDFIDAFNTTSRYLDGILNINSFYFDNMVSQIYPSELQLNKAITL